MSEMKDSGVEWIGEIPEEWECAPLRYIASHSSSTSSFEAESTYVALENIESWTGKTLGFDESVDIESQVFNFGEADVLFGKLRPYLAKVVMPRCKGQSSTELIPITPKKCTTRFLFWLLINKGFIDTVNSITYGVKMPRTSWPQMGQIYFPLPALEEQQLIASYLDEQVEHIDKKGAILERQIDVLERYKKSIIHEAVTKGLDPDVAMRPSGVEWIGDIPEHWEFTKMRAIGSCQNGISKEAEYFGTGYPFISYGNVYRDELSNSKEWGLIESNSEERSRYSVRRGDIFFTRTSETVDEAGIATTALEDIQDATFAGFLIRVRPYKNDLLPEYSRYYFRYGVSRAFFAANMVLVTRASLGQMLLKSLPVLIPPVAEQQQIADYLDDKTAKVDAILDIKRKQVEVLKKRRQSLIYEYVTGKKRVGKED
ncbi:restriction endonuclease subunit S [Adlercreutzia sp. ZJ242]|uniref:restriction endonuclease subunit S n=1 Tax=Adlercreutzia sp. ZJ242 TaxID=2709409 RepID=UPI0013EA7CF5|nr:restriction endonuclease subunit S [Adlercreutzia sp. ZJ242]